MKQTIVLGVLLTLLGPTVATASDIDRQRLVGVWGNSDDGGKTIWGYDQYFADGRLRSWGTLPQTTIKYELEATYQFKQKFGTISCLTITKSSFPEFLPVGEYWCDTIIDVNDNTFTFKRKDGSVATLYRQPS